MVVSDVLRTNELQVWFISEHLVKMPLVHAAEPANAQSRIAVVKKIAGPAIGPARSLSAQKLLATDLQLIVIVIFISRHRFLAALFPDA